MGHKEEFREGGQVPKNNKLKNDRYHCDQGEDRNPMG
jgi:hypothetical protein